MSRENLRHGAEMRQELLRQIPKIDVLLQDERLRQVIEKYGRTRTADVLRTVTGEIRGAVLSGEETTVPDADEILRMALCRLEENPACSLRPVINGTGIILHTNLGRAPLSERALRAVEAAAGGYSNLEYRLDSGSRGSRHDHVTEILRELCGTEDAMVVNNNAAAVLLSLAALARGKEVLVSRGELIEIGGSFRIPDVCEQSGAVLREVGTTNRTRLADYQGALNEETGAVFKAHTSNYRIVGFTEETSLEELSGLALENGIPLIYDMGSGLFEGLERYGIEEPDILHAQKAGADVLTFSGDKLLGAAQAGLIVGRKQYIEKMKRHPLARALRVDKMTLAALEATLYEYRDRNQARREIPVLRMISESPEALRKKAEALCARLAGTAGSGRLTFAVEPCRDRTGGGSAPLNALEGYAVTVRLDTGGSEDISVPEKKCMSGTGIHTLEDLEQSLRLAEFPLIARITQDRLWISVRTLLAGDEEKIAEDFEKISRLP